MMSANAKKLRATSQIRAIFAQGHKCGLDDEGIRDVVESVTRRTRSIRELTHAEAEAVIKQIKGNEFIPLRTLQYHRQKQGVKQLATRAQLDLIAQLASQRAGWTAQTLVDFCKRQCGHHLPRTTDEANKVIEGLKAMNRRDGLWAND